MKWPVLIKRVLAALLLLVCGAAFAAVLVLRTGTGTLWALGRATQLLQQNGVSLQWRSVAGNLWEGLDFADLQLQSAGNTRHTLRVQRIAFRWQPWRLPGALVFDTLTIEGLDYGYDGDPAAANAPLTEAALRERLFTLPFSIELHRLESRVIELRFGANRTAFEVLTGAAQLDAEALTLADLDWQSGASRVGGSAQLTSTLQLDGVFDWASSVDELAYAGTLQATGTLAELQLRHRLQTPLAIDSEGSVVPGLFADPLAVDLQHRFGELSLAPYGQPALSIIGGALQSSGTPAALRITGSFSAVLENFAPAAIDLDLEYRGASVALNRVAIVSLQLAAETSGLYTLEPAALQLGWQLHRLDTGTSLPNLQLAGINGAGRVALSFPAQGLAGEIGLARLSGTLNDQALTLAGSLQLAEAQLASVDLQLVSGNNQLQLAGSTVPALDLRWNLQAGVLAQLWSGLSGTLAGQGSVTGTVEVPAVNGELRGARLGYVADGSRMQLEALELTASYGPEGNDINLRVQNLQQGTTSTNRQMLLQEGTARLRGTPAQHELRASLVAPAAELELVARGAYADGSWQGSLQSAGVASTFGDWSLQEPAALAWTDAAWLISRHCWTYQFTNLCLQADGAAAGINAQAAVTAVPLGWLNTPGATLPDGQSERPTGIQELLTTYALTLPANLLLEGQTDLQLELHNYAAGSWDSIDLVVEPHEPVLQLTQQQDSEQQSLAPQVQRFVFYDNELGLSQSAGQWRGTAALRIARQGAAGNQPQGSVRGTGSLADDGTLGGELSFAFTDLSWLESVVPALREPAGTLNGAVTLGGTRAEPRIDSELRLQGGSFALPQYGIGISAVDIALRNVATDEITLEASAGSGDGTLALQARITDPLLPERSVSATLTGQDFLAFKAAFATATVSPELQLDYAAEALSVRGRLAVPMMDLDLEGLFGTLGGNVVPVSRDTVVVRAADGTAPDDMSQGGQIPFTVDVTLALGEDVALRGFGLDATIDGELQLEQQPNRALLTYGELGIPEGSYELYNQRLATRNGRLMFFGNPANPVVDIRAFRETESAEVGMLLSGPINNMQGQLYSTPTLPESEVLAMLVTGKSFSNVGAEDSDALLSAIANFGFERGQGLTSIVGNKLGLDTLTVGSGNSLRESSLGVGKYLTPDLLMSYKVGLFDRQAVLSINYSLSERLKLQVETGISQSVDISYTVEKD